MWSAGEESDQTEQDRRISMTTISGTRRDLKRRSVAHPMKSDPSAPASGSTAISQVARDTLRPRLLVAFLAALASVAVGTWKRLLPGTR